MPYQYTPPLVILQVFDFRSVRVSGILDLMNQETTTPKKISKRRQILLSIGLAFGLQVIASITMTAIAITWIISTTGQQPPQDSTAIMSYLTDNAWPALTIAMFAQGVVGILLYKRLDKRFFKTSPEDFDHKQKGVCLEFATGVLIGFGLISLGVLVMMMNGSYQPVGLQLVPGILYGLALGFGAAFVEEPAYRGFLLGGLAKVMSPARAIIYSSIVFGLMHLMSSTSAGGDQALGLIGIIVSTALLFAGAYFLTKRLWLAIGIHLGWNFTLGGVYGLAVSGLPAAEGFVKHQEVTGSHLVTGGNFGPEGSLTIMVLGAAIGAVMLWMAHKKGNLKTTSQKV